MTGGFALGAYWAGMKFKNHFCSDIEKYCVELYKLRFPDSIQLGDITKIDYKELKDFVVDISARKYNIDIINFMEIIMSNYWKKMSDEKLIEAIKLYESGLSIQEVADYFQVSRQAMWDVLRLRIKLRSNKKYGEENHFYREGKTASKRAQHIVERAIKKGILIVQNCEICNDKDYFKDGRVNIQAHHYDYNKPLEVRWLCQKCHHEWHKNNKAIKEVKRKSSDNFVVTGGFP